MNRASLAPNHKFEYFVKVAGSSQSTVPLSSSVIRDNRQYLVKIDFFKFIWNQSHSNNLSSYQPRGVLVDIE